LALLTAPRLHGTGSLIDRPDPGRNRLMFSKPAEIVVQVGNP
jgi:hypothetical protein